MIDRKGFIQYLCDDCKRNVAEQTSKLTLKDKLRPKRVAKKSVKWICADCRNKIEKALR